MNMNELQDSLPQIGRVEWIGVRPERYEDLKAVDQVEVQEDKGLAADHFQGILGSKRQVTLIQKEHLQAVASYMGLEKVDPNLTRRNIVTQGINLHALKDRRFIIGEVLFEGTGNCAPCSRMEENLGPGGWNAMRGHGGICARVIEAGTIKVGDEVKLAVTAMSTD
ncbi:MAG: MOSC domain-containing protein [Cyclobacteriaceae bacterium]|nr:MOSC domain-containing protein [Cyclobacteriaceae bacterium]